MRRLFSFALSVFYKLASLWENPFWAAAIALVIYLAYALHVNPTLKASAVNYHNYLADAFLHGQLSLRLIPLGSQLDLSLFNQKYYLYWPPLPAILLMPLVALFGVNFSDVIFTLIFAILNVSLVALLVRKVNEKGNCFTYSISAKPAGALFCIWNCTFYSRIVWDCLVYKFSPWFFLLRSGIPFINFA